MQDALEASISEPAAQGLPTTIAAASGTTNPALTATDHVTMPDDDPATPISLNLQAGAPEAAANGIVEDLGPLTMEVDAPDGTGTVTVDMSTIGK